MNINSVNKNFVNNTIHSTKKTAITHKSKTIKAACLMGLMALSAASIATIKINTKASNSYVENPQSKKEFTNKYGNYGKYYLNNIPDNNPQKHIELLNELAYLCKENQGCEFSNPAVLNGLTCKEIETKVLTPARSIAQNIPFGENQKTLALIGFERGLDDKKAFEKDFQNKNMTQKMVF